MAIRVGSSFVEVDEVAGDVITSWRIGDDIEEFYFRPGSTLRGEDSARWYLFEWRDVPAPRALLEGAAAEPTPVRRFTWGQLKTRF
jgi:hypothetical protein